MITVQITGGLGNQLFQYAAAKSLAMNLGTDFQLDLTEYGDKNPRNFELSLLNTNYRVALPEEVKQLERRGFIPKVIDRLKPSHKRKKYREPHFHFDPNFFKASPNTYLKGNWQSEKYFLPIASVIKNEFKMKTEPAGSILEKALIMKKEQSVSIHIRRGDYLKPAFQKFHGLLSKDYYNDAIRIFEQRFGLIKIYFFSDDINWVKDNIHIHHRHEFVSGNISQSAMDDFYLMQHCRHNIIANSSFSWWAAWLNSNPDKTIVAPVNWFNEAKYNTKDLLPARWIKV